MTEAPGGERADAMRALEVEFTDLTRRFRRLIAENAEKVSPGLLPAAYKLFTTIVERETVTQSQLADILMVDKGQLSRTVRELEERGLIARSPDPADGRSSLISATPDGLDRLATARQGTTQFTRIVAEWDVDDIRTLTRLLGALVAGDVPGR